MSEFEFQRGTEKQPLLRYWLLIIAALLVRHLLLINEGYTYEYSKYVETIFVPFSLFQITEFVFFRPSIPRSSIFNMFFVFNLGISSRNVEKLIMLYKIFSRVFSDIMVYFFAFVCSDCLITFIAGDE